MARSLEPLEKLGHRVASLLEQAAPHRERAIEQARRAFLEYELSARIEPRRSSRGVALWAGGLGIAMLAALVVVVTERRAALTFDVNGTQGVAKTWLAAPTSAPLRLDFSEGTSVRLEPASRARVVELEAQGASLSLESGALHAEVVHRSDSAWKVVAGPFTVAVTGTVFDVNWDPETEQLSVSVARGSVAVRESNGGPERAVRASETLHATSSDHHFELSESDAARGSAPDANPTPASSAEATEPPEAHEPSTVNDDSSEPAPAVIKEDAAKTSAWREYAKRGALREAYASAEAAGFAASCASASPADLLLLGDGARLSGKPDRAVEALLALRRRFPRDPRRAAAAFALGKVAFDQRGAYEQAAEWFSTSLREQPSGPLAREASGRLIEALRRADDSAGARRAARDYLGRYPEGPHADLARSVLH